MGLNCIFDLLIWLSYIESSDILLSLGLQHFLIDITIYRISTAKETTMHTPIMANYNIAGA